MGRALDITVLGTVPDGAHFSSTVGNGAEVFPCTAQSVQWTLSAPYVKKIIDITNIDTI